LDYHLRCLGLKAATLALKEKLVATQQKPTQPGGDWLQDHSLDQIMSDFEARAYINNLQMVQLLENLTKEAIESLLWLTQVHYQWLEGQEASLWKPGLKAHLNLAEVVGHFLARQQEWQGLQATITSPHQRAYLFNADPSDSSFPQRISKLLVGLSIRQIALILNQDELKVARLLQPHIQNGEVCLRAPKPPLDRLPTIPVTAPATGIAPTSLPSKTYTIACIDDSPTILEAMDKFLSHEEYEVTKIRDPIKSTALLFRLKPDLILMDITMPEINGYKLCSLLRNSVALRETPIVIVTGRASLLDKARAKMNGATDYLLKPFTRGSLLSMVEKHLQSGP
jgi:twitching motility two-component system response regulator PilG